MDVQKYLGGALLSHMDLAMPYCPMTIQSVEEQVLDGKPKVCVRFTETPKPLACNKTNLTRLCELYGKDTNAWNGHQVLVYRSTTNYQGQTRRCVRLCGPTQAPPDPICDQQGNLVAFQQPLPTSQQPDVQSPRQVAPQQPVQSSPQVTPQQPVQAPAAIPDPWQGQQQQNPPAQ